MSPDWHKAKYQAKSEKCLVEGVDIQTALNCFEANGIKGFKIYKNQYDYMSCSPYWGYPMVASCGGIKIDTDKNGIVTWWRTWGSFDGV